ncbi:MAG: hypothetical protein NUW02_00980 [Candidatus Campbellbacteria bacterium]|nr:hypothetical protein [Candidatus Campbellbacteria bacterium]
MQRNVFFVGSALTVVAIVGILCFTFGRETSEQHLARETAQVQAKNQNVANDLLGSLRYMKDPRTGICFAFTPTFYPNEFAFTTIPCEAIPPELLITPTQ